MNQIAKQPAKTPTASQKFRGLTTSIARQLLTDWVGPDRAREAAGRVMNAMSACASSARNPSDFYECTPQSIGNVVATAALTGIMPSTGSTALAYAIPRRARKGEAPQLQYSLSHRGLNSLARRCGQHMIAVAVGYDADLSFEDGEVIVHSIDYDNPPETFEEVRGVIVNVKEIKSGLTIARGWMPIKLIEKRRAMSDAWRYDEKSGNSYSPWSTFPVEQCLKTAMHYAASRGWCVIDDTEAVRAMSNDMDSSLPEISAVSGERIGQSATSKLADKLGIGGDDNEPEQTPEQQEMESQAQEQDAAIDAKSKATKKAPAKKAPAKKAPPKSDGRKKAPPKSKRAEPQPDPEPEPESTEQAPKEGDEGRTVDEHGHTEAYYRWNRTLQTHQGTREELIELAAEMDADDALLESETKLFATMVSNMVKRMD